MSGNKITNDIESANKTEYTNLSNELDTTTGRRNIYSKSIRTYSWTTLYKFNHSICCNV